MNALIGFGLGLLAAVIVVMAFCIWAVQRDNSAEPLGKPKPHDASTCETCINEESGL